jgi:uncharacterized tellurite resistance protein B-like protein
MGKMFKAENLVGTSDTVKTAVMDCLVAALFGDGNPDPKEVARFDQEIAKIPFGMSGPELLALAKASKERVQKAVSSSQAAVEFLKKTAAMLPTQDLKEKTYYSIASIMLADRQVSKDEQQLLIAYAVVFGLNEGQVKEIITAAKSTV